MRLVCQYYSNTGPFVCGGILNDQLELFNNEPFCVRLKFNDAVAIFWENHWQHCAKGLATQRALKRIRQFFAPKYIDEISKKDVEDLRRWLKNLGLKQNTINTHHMIITLIFNKMVEYKEAKVVNGIDFSVIQLPQKNPGEQVPHVNELQFSRKIAWPKSVVYKLIDTARSLQDFLLADIIEMLYLTGLRPCDIWELKAVNVDFAHMILSGIQKKTITSHLPSGIPYSIALTERMASIFRIRIESAAGRECIFRDSKMSLVAWKAAIQRRFNMVRKFAGLPHVQLRDFRPSGATLLIDNGIDPETVREKYGWTTPRMMPVYARRTIVHQRKAQAILEDPEKDILK